MRRSTVVPGLTVPLALAATALLYAPSATAVPTAMKAASARGDAASSCTPGASARVQSAMTAVLGNDQTDRPVPPDLQEPPALPGALGAITNKAGKAVPYTAGQFPVHGRGDVGSVTKSFTAALILQLDQERRLSIHDKISKWRNAINWKGSRSVLKTISVKQVLRHTSGIPELLEAPQVKPYANNPDFNPSPRQLVGWASQQPMLFAPGTSWAYSNTDYEILGLIIEAVTGQSYASNLRTRLITPLGLTGTSLGTAPKPAVQGYYLSPVDPSIVPTALQWTPISATANSQVRWSWAAGGLQSTSCDLATWAHSLLATGKVLDRAHRALMTTPSRQSLTEVPKYGVPGWTGYGLGLMRVTVAGKTGWGHLGNIPGFSSAAINVKARKISTSVILPSGAANATDAMTRLVESAQR